MNEFSNELFLRKTELLKCAMVDLPVDQVEPGGSPSIMFVAPLEHRGPSSGLAKMSSVMAGDINRLCDKLLDVLY
jgi:hypothetical protein